MYSHVRVILQFRIAVWILTFAAEIRQAPSAAEVVLFAFQVC
jgi:hypothetical protein